MPELGWSLSEALFVPLLLKLHLPDRLLTICWLFSPIIGLVMHPVVGAQADIHGRRPFILFFGLVSAAGLAFMLVCAALPDGAVLAILAFGLADSGHDLLYSPTCSQMNDVFDTDESEHRCAVISGIQLIQEHHKWVGKVGPSGSCPGPVNSRQDNGLGVLRASRKIPTVLLPSSSATIVNSGVQCGTSFRIGEVWKTPTRKSPTYKSFLPNLNVEWVRTSCSVG
mmetsp:Transcript_2188/g.7559  ORF Transcript_2188/g.7559 Transcript_2188/m.7559 type:complete len:225 (-) Transcript_2188:20-694(-)